MLQKPERDEWGSGIEALECALQLEKSVNQSLLDMHKLCSDHNDPHVSIKVGLTVAQQSTYKYISFSLSYLSFRTLISNTQKYRALDNPETDEIIS